MGKNSKTLYENIKGRGYDGKTAADHGNRERDDGTQIYGATSRIDENYKAEETEIIAGLQEKLQEVFQKAQQMQKVDRKGKICTMGVSYLQSSVLTGSYDLRIDLYDKEFYLDSAECCTYWKPAFITEYIQKDIKYFKYNIHGKVPQIRTYEIQEFMDGYIINYLYLLAQFLEQIMPQILCKVRPAFREVMDDGMHVILENTWEKE